MSEFIKISYLESDIALIAMEDRINCNALSTGFIQKLISAFEDIKHSKIKAVIIHGYDNYFCSGGTKELLFKVYNREATFADINFYDLLLQCEVPTIAAMQGHALGGGLAFGCYADFIILAREAIYTANFMKYGFTPGMGSTYIIPKKFGESVGNEMLYTADTYSGGALKDKGVPVAVLAKSEVIKAGVDIAKEISKKPLNALKLLKANLVQETRKKLPFIIEQELSMHDISFANEDVKLKIDTLFGI